MPLGGGQLLTLVLVLHGCGVVHASSGAAALTRPDMSRSLRGGGEREERELTGWDPLWCSGESSKAGNVAILSHITKGKKSHTGSSPYRAGYEAQQHAKNLNHNTVKAKRKEGLKEAQRGPKSWDRSIPENRDVEQVSPTLSCVHGDDLPVGATRHISLRNPQVALCGLGFWLSSRYL